MVPNNFSGSIIKSAQSGISPQVAVAPSPPFRFTLNRIVKNAEEAPGVHIEKSSLRTKARRHPIRRAVGSWFNERPVRSRRGLGLGDRASSRINTGGPSLVNKFRGDQMLSRRPVQYKEKSIAARLREQLTRFAFEFSVEQNRCLDGIPVVHVVWRRLKIPSEFAC